MPPPSATADVCREVEPRIWRACAGSSVQIPSLHSRVYYFPQGHVEHCCPSALISSHALPAPFVPCVVSAVQLLADPITDEVFARLLLQPVSPAEFSSLDDVSRCGRNANGHEESKILTFAKTLTPSDANNGGGFSVPRFCADSIFPPLDYKADPPVQTLSITDIHGVVWDFRHIFRGTPRRHLLTTGWSKFVNHKKLIAGDSVVFMKNFSGEMFLGIRRAVRSFNGGRGGGYTGDDFYRWHDQNSGGAKEEDVGGPKWFGRSGKGKLTAEAVAEAVEMAARGRPFEVVYYPKAGWADFVVNAELVEASLAVFWAPGMRVKMAMETEDSSRTTWFQGIISSTFQETGPWHGSPWRLLQVTWDEPEILQNAKRVSPWQVELVATPNQLHHTFPPTKRFKFPHSTGFSSEGDEEIFCPQRGWSNATSGNRSPLLLNHHTFPAGMQGARQNHLRSFSLTNVMGENPPHVFINSFFDSVPGLKRVPTELNIGSPPSDDLSPNSRSTIHSCGTDLVGNRGFNSARVGGSSFQLFGKTIHVHEPSESGLDDSGCFEEDGSKGSSAIEEGMNDTLDLSLACGSPEHV